MNNRFKGLTRAGMGRKPGATNKITRSVKACVAEFVEHNMDGAQALYDRVAKKNPAMALELLARFAEFVLPKNAYITAEVGPPPKPPSLGFTISFENGGPGLYLPSANADADQSEAAPVSADVISFPPVGDSHE